ncbi:response regulator [Paraglaciecola chathamensis]|uniref:response regulator n=1 Tax=Paraglaciecola chathamensis TaxID=368405 RepID=UPI0002E0BDFE|nr:response regulator [Paraglaciecola agarilytica]
MIKIPPQAPISELHVLVIDGQSLVQDTIKSAFHEVGIEHVRCAQNAFYAIRLCEHIRFDVILVAFDVRSDKDGFNLLEEMRFKGFIAKTTSVIFLSADTSPELVNCVMELQPDDFWVKPLDKYRVAQRINHILKIKSQLYRLNYCFDHQEYPSAIYLAQRQLEDESLAQYRPQINRLIGRCLFNLQEYADAETFYRTLLKECDYGWVAVGLVRTLLQQDKIVEAQALADDLLERDDTRFATYDALTEYYISQEDYEKGYELIKEASKLAPRNIQRHRKAWDLARLNHDPMGQYLATQNMAKYAKNSIHDSPELILNVIRAGIDLASTVSTTQAKNLLAETERKLLNVQQEFAHINGFKNQLIVIQARLLSLKDKKQQAEQLMQEQAQVNSWHSVEDNLDKVKAFHEIGQREQSLAILERMKEQINGNDFTNQVMAEYLEQEQFERTEIHHNPKELAEMASVHYKNKRFSPAYKLLTQALQLSPKNTNIGLSLLKVLTRLAQDDGLNEEQESGLKHCKTLLKTADLSTQQKLKQAQYLDSIKQHQATRY